MSTAPKMDRSNSGMMRTAEHVSPGHPDKACDQFADAILDQVLAAAHATNTSNPTDANHPGAQRTAIEMLAKDYVVVVSGEMRMGPNVAPHVNVDQIVRQKWQEIGYPHADKVTVLNHLQVQVPELQANADHGGAGDQGIMVGYATGETKSGLPREYEAARDLCRSIRELGKSATAPWIRADVKTQVTLDSEGRIDRVVIAVQHDPNVDGSTDPALIQKRIKAVLMEHAIEPILGRGIPQDRVTVNGSGSFAVGGTVGDAGVVGRKIVVDAYGPHVPVGGGAYSGKDPTKVDRSAAYMARHIAKTAVSMGIRGAKSVTVHIAYCIGLHQPEMVTAFTDTGVDISDWVHARFTDLAPRAISEQLGLWAPAKLTGWRYQDTAAFGHYGREMFPWEAIARVSD